MRTLGTFFGKLGRLAGSQQRENQFSRTFAACFNESAVFRNRTINLFWEKLGHRSNPPDPEHWQCSAEVATPLGGGGRVDLHFTHVGRSGTVLRDFYVESKVESPLTLRQVKKYRTHGVESLLVITKHRAEEPLSGVGVCSIRWQDVHRELRKPTGARAVDKQLCEWMADYLEELDMAYREDLTVEDLASCGKLFRSVGTAKRGWSQLSARRVFEIAHSCSGMLDDLHQDFLDAHPALEAKPYINSRTNYGKWIDPVEGSETHSIGWTIAKRHWNRWQLVCSMAWEEQDSQDGGSFFVGLQGSTVKARTSTMPLQKFATGGVIERAKLLRHLTSCVRKWHVTR